jgi:hypothetical protein
MRSNITIVNEHDDNFDISLLKFLPSIIAFDTIIAIENIAINQNIEISPNPNQNPLCVYIKKYTTEYIRTTDLLDQW